MQPLLLAIAIALAGGGGVDDPAPPVTDRPPAERYERPRRTGTFKSAAIRECSGIAASRWNAGVFWVHNDSGDDPRVFAVDREGELVAEVLVAGATARDWEDIAIGPGPEPGKPYLYIADTGDNERSRTDLRVWRIPEPSLKGLERGKRWRSAAAEAIRFSYSRGSFDCEALAVHPRTGDLYLVTKAPFTFDVFRIESPADLDRVHTAEHVARLRSVDVVTAADISPDGRRIALRTYFGLVELVLGEDDDFETIFKTAPGRLPAPRELQGEAVGYTPEGDIITASEGPRAPIHILEKK